jgi:N-methylhydantoinase B
MTTNKKIDPITLQVIRGAIETIAAEMAHVLFRMSFSSIIRESEDLGAGLFDTDFNTLCESESTPMHIGSIPAYLKGIRDTMDDGQWFEGDVVVHNHPYHGSSHTPDLAIVIPIFYRGELVGYSANTAHHIDIGAATPGLIIDVPDIYGEGMLFAGTKLYRKGERNDTIWNFIRRNSRAAGQLTDDIEAQIASARLGARRFTELLDHYGKDMVFDACNQLMDYSETLLRQRIAAIPDGEYRAEGWLDDDGRNRDRHLPVKVCVRVIGDRVEVDLTGSAPQTPTAYNVPFEGSTKVAAFAAFRKLLLDAETSETRAPSNQGSFRPITVIAPEGTIFNPIAPAAAEARFTQCNAMIDLIIKALAPAAPDHRGVLGFDLLCLLCGGASFGRLLDVPGGQRGAYGGRPGSDGPDSIDNLMANTRNNPLEDLAMHIPMICERYELRDDIAAGAGKMRGGIGVVKAQRMLTDGIITHESERHTSAPWGVFGGHEGARGNARSTTPSPMRRHVPCRRNSMGSACRRTMSWSITAPAAAAMAIRWNAIRPRCLTMFWTASARPRMRARSMAWCSISRRRPSIWPPRNVFG